MWVKIKLPIKFTRNNFKTINWITVLLIMLVIAGCAQAPKFEQGISFYPPPPGIPRIQFLTSITNEADIGAEYDEFKEFISGKKELKKIISRPWDMEHEPGKLYVVDKNFGMVVIVDFENSAFEYLSDTGGGALKNPGGLFIARGGYKYIADQGRNQVLVYDGSNRFVRAYEAEPEFRPLDVVVSDDRVYATDVNKNEIKIFDRETGEIRGTIDGLEENGGELRTPTSLAIDADGFIYVTDFLNFRVQKFDGAGNYIRTMGEPGDFPGSMPRPKGIAVDREQHLYAVDSAFEMVQIFDTEAGDALLSFGKFGSASGGSWLPAGIHIDYDNLEYFSRYVDPRFKAKYLIYVANQSGPFKINVFAFGDWQGEQQLPGVRKQTTGN